MTFSQCNAIMHCNGRKEYKLVKLCSFTLDVMTIEKLNWVVENTAQKSKSALVDRLIELEFIRIKALRDEN